MKILVTTGATVTVAMAVVVATVREVAVVVVEEAMIVVLAEVVGVASSLEEEMVATVTVETTTRDIKVHLKKTSGDDLPLTPIRQAQEEVAEVACLQAVAATTQPLSLLRVLSRSSTTTRTANKIVVMMVTMQSTDKVFFSVQFLKSWRRCNECNLI
jgi:hypothetical protein